MGKKKVNVDLELADPVVLYTKSLQDFEITASILTYLAYPTASEEKLESVHASLCARELRLRYKADPQQVWRPQLIKPAYLMRDVGKINRDILKVGQKLNHRMIAARMAIPFFQLAVNHPPRLPKSVKRLSLNQMSELVLSDLGGHGDSHNVEARIWRPSLPVIHLAVAMAVSMNDRQRLGFGSFTADDLMGDLNLTKRVLVQAEMYEMLIVASPRLKIPPEKLIRLRID